MSKAKGWIIAATALTVSGLVLIGGTLAAVGFNIKNLSTVKYTDVTKVIDKTFDSIDIDAAIRRKMEINKGRPWKHGKSNE